MKARYTGIYVLGFVGITALSVTNVIYAATELARINNTVISLEEFNKKYKDNLRFFQLKQPSRQNVLDDLIKRELGIQKAKQLGLEKDPEVIDRINTVLYHALLEKELSKQFESIHVTDEAAKSFYDKNPEIRTSHIFVGVKPGATAKEQQDAQNKIKKISEQNLRDPKMSFAEVAQRFSEGPAAPMGGDIDYQTRDRLDPAYYEAALKLGSPGKVSGIIRSRFGYHIIKLTAIRSWEDVDKAQVKRLVFEEQREKIFEKYMGTLRTQTKVVTHPELIKD
jgi:peptidyl-prolyl cis-trans isomerase C/peptidyl-prolyl cis-trans isomerase D